MQDRWFPPGKHYGVGENVPQISPNRAKLGPRGFKDTFREESDLLASHDSFYE